MEAKDGKENLKKACDEAMEYSDKVNSKSKLIKVHFATGVSGNDVQGFDIKSFYKQDGKWKEIKIGKHLVHRFLSRNEIQRIIETNSADLKRPEPSTAEITVLSNKINTILHEAKVSKEKRASYVSILLLALNEDSSIKLGNDAAIFLNDISTRAEKAFSVAGKSGLWDQIKIRTTPDNQAILAKALDEVILLLKESDLLHSAESSDILGAFFEGFLRYGNTSKELGIVLTPRHICWLAAEVMQVDENDFVYDPAVGTGGFLIASFNRVKKLRTSAVSKKFAQDRLFGVETSDVVASLAFINMYFRGDGKHNLKIDSCFNWSIAGATKNSKDAKFFAASEVQDKNKKFITKVLMNPPFSLKNDKQKEVDFIDHALSQLVDNGLLFCLIPSSVLYEQQFSSWKTTLLSSNTILSVILFPPDLFYPVATETAGLFIKKGVPHEKQEVLWGKILDDGFIKKKGFRVEKNDLGAEVNLKDIVNYLKSWINHGTKFKEIPGIFEYGTIQSTELIPQAHLGIPNITPQALESEAKNVIKNIIVQSWDKYENS